MITTPISFVASSNCLLYEGVRPVFVDIEDETFNTDPQKIEQAITPRTKGILIVHIFGQTANMAPIVRIARRHRLLLIEDACESICAAYKGKLAGTFGDIATFAFYPNKQMTTGEGGMIVTNSKKLHTLCVQLRNQGRKLSDSWLIHTRLGYNYRLDEMSAALGISQLTKLSWMLGERAKVASYYQKYLQAIPNLILPQIGAGRTHTWFVFVIRVLGNKRNILMQELLRKGIQTRPYLPSIHLQPYLRKQFGYKRGDYPISERIASQTLALPLYIGLTEQDISHICQEIREILQ